MAVELSFFAPVRQEMAEVDRRLKEAAAASYHPLAQHLDRVLDTGGKRLRPTLTLLASKTHPAPEPEFPILMATGVELLHLATLIHDDTVDNSSVRRGRSTLSSLFGQRIAVLVGDYIFAKSATLVCATNNVQVVRIFAETIMHLSSGELQETYEALNWAQTRDQYFQRVFDKTACLFQIAAETGAILADAPQETIERLRSYGYYVGMAFQVVDDLLDFQGEEQEVGKPVGSDLLQGTITLPVILFLEDAKRRDLVQLPKEPDPEALRQLTERVRSSAALQECFGVAKDLVSQAREAVEGLPDGEARRSLLELSQYVLERRK